MTAKDLHFYEPKNGHGLKHDPFNAIVAPRPIGWISSRGARPDGRKTLGIARPAASLVMTGSERRIVVDLRACRTEKRHLLPPGGNVVLRPGLAVEGDLVELGVRVSVLATNEETLHAGDDNRLVLVGMRLGGIAWNRRFGRVRTGRAHFGGAVPSPLELQSTVGQGTTVICRFPLEQHVERTAA